VLRKFIPLKQTKYFMAKFINGDMKLIPSKKSTTAAPTMGSLWWVARPWSRDCVPSLTQNPLLFPHSIRLSLSLFSSPLFKTSIVNPHTSSFLHPIPSKFFAKFSNFFLFLHFPHKSFFFLSKFNLIPHLLSTSFSLNFTPFYL